MNRDKQIEIARELCPFSQEYESCSKCNTELDIDGEPCIYMIMAKHITDKGYRKASDVAMEICCKIEEEIVRALESNYNAKAERMRKPCIDMADEFIGWVEGKITALRGIEDFVAELKKKYESEENKE